MARTDAVRFGVKLPFGGSRTVEDSVRIAQAAEVNGFDAAWHSDHVAFPATVSDDYPYIDSGASPFDVDHNGLELFEVLSYLAAVTDDIRLGTHVCVAPYRHPVLLTKQALTLDNLTDGRFDFGIGVGWLSSEFEALSVPFEERGSRTDEFLEIFSKAAESGAFAFDGAHHTFPETGFHPRPVQDGGPPISIGGESGATFRRIGQFGDGWMATGMPPDTLASGVDRLKTAWADYDRDGTPDVSIKQSTWIGDVPDGIGPPMTGSAADVIEDVERYVDAGADLVMVDFRRTHEAPVERFAAEKQVAQLERFADEVVSHFRD